LYVFIDQRDIDLCNHYDTKSNNIMKSLHSNLFMSLGKVKHRYDLLKQAIRTLIIMQFVFIVGFDWLLFYV